MVVLDTDIIIQSWKENEEAINAIDYFIDNKIYLEITIINLLELYRGIYLSTQYEKNLKIIKEFLEYVDILSLTEESCKIYGKIYKDLKETGKLINDFDLIIAAIVIQNNTSLITRNIKHFENIKELKVESW